MFRPLLAFCFILAALVLAGCSGSANPQLIASYPKSPPGLTRPESEIPPQPGQVIYQSYLVMAVSNVEAARARAGELVYQYGGYLAGSRTWFQDSRQYATLTLVVPAYNEERLRNELIGLGELMTENVTGEVIPYRRDNAGRFSQIDLQLCSRSYPGVSFPLKGWRPVQTIERAFKVFLSIFGFVTDILIWLVVVIGPFILVGAGIWILTRRIRSSR